jgi:PIN domain nuclease of toxin-antitoxin system
VRLLLDTHAFLWLNAGDTALSARARRAIEDVRNDRFLSIASLWEIAIKLSLKKLELEVELAELVQGGAIENGIAFIDIAPRHALGVVRLPFHHRDPFDRMLVAQAKAERLVLVSCDTTFDAYGVKRLW